MPTAPLQSDQLIWSKVGAEMVCSLLPGKRVERLGVEQQTIQIKQAGPGFGRELIQRSHPWLSLPLIDGPARKAPMSSFSSGIADH